MWLFSADEDLAETDAIFRLALPDLNKVVKT